MTIFLSAILLIAKEIYFFLGVILNHQGKLSFPWRLLTFLGCW